MKSLFARHCKIPQKIFTNTLTPCRVLGCFYTCAVVLCRFQYLEMRCIVSKLLRCIVSNLGWAQRGVRRAIYKDLYCFFAFEHMTTNIFPPQHNLGNEVFFCICLCGTVLLMRGLWAHFFGMWGSLWMAAQPLVHQSLSPVFCHLCWQCTLPHHLGTSRWNSHLAFVSKCVGCCCELCHNSCVGIIIWFFNFIFIVGWIIKNAFVCTKARIEASSLSLLSCFAEVTIKLSFPTTFLSHSVGNHSSHICSLGFPFGRLLISPSENWMSMPLYCLGILRGQAFPFDCSRARSNSGIFEVQWP